MRPPVPSPQAVRPPATPRGRSASAVGGAPAQRDNAPALAIAQLLLGGMQLSKEHPAGALLCALCFFATLVRDRTLRNHYGALAKRLPLERLREIDDAERRAGLRHTLSDFAVEYQGPWS